MFILQISLKFKLKTYLYTKNLKDNEIFKDNC